MNILWVAIAVATICCVGWMLRSADGSAPERESLASRLSGLSRGGSWLSSRAASMMATAVVGPMVVIDRHGTARFKAIANHVADARVFGEQSLPETGKVVARSQDYVLLCGSDVIEQVRPHMEAICLEAQQTLRNRSAQRGRPGPRVTIDVPRLVEDPSLPGQVHLVTRSEGHARESELAAQQEEETRTAERRLARMPRLVRAEGEGTETLPFSYGGNTYGRAEHHGEGQLAVRLASRDHAQSGIDHRGPWIADLGSKHQTTVNGQPIGRDRVYLGHGDVVTLSPEAMYRFEAGTLADFDTPEE